MTKKKGRTSQSSLHITRRELQGSIRHRDSPETLEEETHPAVATALVRTPGPIQLPNARADETLLTPGDTLNDEELWDAFTRNDREEMLSQLLGDGNTDGHPPIESDIGYGFAYWTYKSEDEDDEPFYDEGCYDDRGKTKNNQISSRLDELPGDEYEIALPHPNPVNLAVNPQHNVNGGKGSGQPLGESDDEAGRRLPATRRNNDKGLTVCALETTRKLTSRDTTIYNGKRELSNQERYNLLSFDTDGGPPSPVDESNAKPFEDYMDNNNNECYRDPSPGGNDNSPNAGDEDFDGEGRCDVQAFISEKHDGNDTDPPHRVTSAAHSTKAPKNEAPEEVPAGGSALLPPLLCPHQAFLASLILASKFSAWEIGHCERTITYAIGWTLCVTVSPQTAPRTPYGRTPNTIRRRTAEDDADEQAEIARLVADHAQDRAKIRVLGFELSFKAPQTCISRGLMVAEDLSLTSWTIPPIVLPLLGCLPVLALWSDPWHPFPFRFPLVVCWLSAATPPTSLYILVLSAEDHLRLQALILSLILWASLLRLTCDLCDSHGDALSSKTEALSPFSCTTTIPARMQGSRMLTPETAAMVCSPTPTLAKEIKGDDLTLRLRPSVASALGLATSRRLDENSDGLPTALPVNLSLLTLSTTALTSLGLPTRYVPTLQRFTHVLPRLVIMEADNLSGGVFSPFPLFSLQDNPAHQSRTLEHNTLNPQELDDVTHKQDKHDLGFSGRDSDVHTNPARYWVNDVATLVPPSMQHRDKHNGHEIL
ncbi:hypothetical protein EDB83DRAFT_2642659 [Lactarius deliciosus]|nr:hypothetical protein EDB83DRAFT_2642659 [Lactarius deliciosus]